MLERVGMGQARFNVPGLTTDGRGAALGRQWLARFGAIDRLVSFFRVWSAEQSLDDVHADLRIVQVRREGGSREVVVLFSVTSPGVAESAARAARLAGGDCFTGSGKQFVQFRDGRAPLGYDVASVVPAGGADFVLYSTEQTTLHFSVGELALAKLLLRLDLQRDPKAAVATSAGERLFVRVRRGLGPVLLEYLFRAQRANPSLTASAAVCEAEGAGGPRRFDRTTGFWLFRVQGLPVRLAAALARTPGITLLAPVADHIAVAIGYRHPVHLEGCRAQLPSETLFLFAPPPVGVTSITPYPALTEIADLVRLPGTGGLYAQPLEAEVPPVAAVPRPAEAARWSVPLRLEAAPAGEGRPAATLIPWRQAGWLRSLCYALPPSVLQGHRLALLERGLLVVAADTLFGIPFGRLFYAPAPGLLVPLGSQLRPAVAPHRILAELGGVGGGGDLGGVVVFVGADEPPFRIAPETLRPLEAAVLSEPSLREIAADAGLAIRLPAHGDGEGRDVEIDYQGVGMLPLWGIGR